MEKLEETVLAIGSRLTKINNCSRVLNNLSLLVHSLTVAFHIELLDVRGKFA